MLLLKPIYSDSQSRICQDGYCNFFFAKRAFGILIPRCHRGPKIQSRHLLSGQTRGDFGAVTRKSFVPPKFCCAQKYLFYRYDKNKNFSPLKCILTPQTLKTGCRPGSDKIVSAIKVYF